MIPYGRQSISEADIEAVVDVLRSDFLTQGPAVPAFEAALESRTGAACAVAATNATSALHLACRALGIGPGDEVWVPAITFVASANCALYCGAKVDFVDIDPLVIAELSGNHNQSLDRALALIDAAAEHGAHAVKFQTYLPETMTLDLNTEDFVIAEADSLWHGRSLFDLYGEAHTPWEWHGPMFERARERGLLAFSSAFDTTAVDFLEELDVPCYKVASFEATDLPLVRYVASKGRPMIISTGMCSVAEIDETVRTAREAGCDDIVLLKCTSSYPSTPEHSNIRTIPHLAELFRCQVGLSDHTRGIGVAVASVALGATVIEKHFTLDRNDGGVDSAFSIEPQELQALVEETHRARMGLGGVTYGTARIEQDSLRFRRSIYVTRDLAAGDELTRENVRIIRPGYGLAPRNLDLVLGKRVRRDVARGTALQWDLI